MRTFKCLHCSIEFSSKKSPWDIARGCCKYCSAKCSGEARKNNQLGEKNPRWRGGISKDAYRYTKKSILKYPEKESARRLVRQAIISGLLHRGACVVCGEENAQGHHEDYSKPLDVIWLCRKHHKAIHNRRRAKSAARRIGHREDVKASSQARASTRKPSRREAVGTH